MTAEESKQSKWIKDLRRQAVFHDREKLPGENLLHLLLEIVRAADTTIPEFVSGHFREGYGTEEIGLDGWGYENDRTAGEEADDKPAIRLHLVAFAYSDTEEEDPEALLGSSIDEAIYRTRQFFLKSAAQTRVPLHEVVAPTSIAADAAEYIHNNYGDIKEVQLHLISDLPVDPDADLSEFEGSIEVGDAIMHVSILDRDRLYKLSEQEPGGDVDRVVLDMRTYDDNGGEIGHPVLAVGETGGWEVYVTALTGPQLARFYERYKLKLVNENVRAFLQFKGKTNKGIKSTIGEEPRRFISYNNGISIVASQVIGHGRDDDSASDEVDRELDQILEIRGAQIVNGGQTTAAIYHASLDPALARDIEDVRVFVKITVIPEDDDDARDEAIAKIARYSNTQNAIKTSDLESNWAYFRDLAAAAEECEVPESGGANVGTLWYFERSRGRYAESRSALGDAWSNMRPEKQVIDKVLLADVMNCVSEHPYTAQKGGEGLIRGYLTWLRARNRVDGRFSDQTPRGFGFFGVNRHHGNYDYDNLIEEWSGVVASVIVRRRLEEIYASTEGWMRTVQIRYGLSLAYTAFVVDDWMEIWRLQSVDEFFKRLPENHRRGHASFKDWAVAAGALVSDKITKLSKQKDTAVNDIAKQSSTWQDVLSKARRERLI